MKLVPARLARQAIGSARFTSPGEVVSWFGAMQAQDYLGVQWAVGLRSRGATEASIEQAISDGRVIRTHAFRGTWQYIAPRDVRWTLALVGKRILASAAGRFRQLGLDDRVRGRAAEAFAAALSGGVQHTRKAMTEVLTRAGIDGSETRLAHLLASAELEGVICSGARQGKQATFALLADRIPPAPSLTRDEAVVELSRRYFQSRGPATVRDFVWWTGLPARDARLGIAELGLRSREIDGAPHYFFEHARGRATGAHLLPAFDEYLIAYADRTALLEARHARRINNGGGVFKPAILIDGRIAGTWSRTVERAGVRVRLSPFRRLTAAQRDDLTRASARYARFLGLALVGPTAPRG